MENPSYSVHEAVVSPTQPTKSTKSTHRCVYIGLAVFIVTMLIAVIVGIGVWRGLQKNGNLTIGDHVTVPTGTTTKTPIYNNGTSVTPGFKTSTTTTTTTIITTTTTRPTTSVTPGFKTSTTTTTTTITTTTTRPTTTNNGGTGSNSSNPCTNPTRFKCHNPPLYECIPAQWVCDGTNDCGDGSDETGCDCNPRTQFNCYSTPSRCISRTKLCDGNYDCPFQQFSGIYSSLDEVLCSSYCYSSEVRCEGMCIPTSLQCKGYNFCADHREDKNCACTSLQTRCNDGRGCIEVRKWCDGLRDCRDGSDEAAGCRTASCPNGGQRCPADNSCINPSMICDSINDCPDGSDEKNCTWGCRYSEFTCNDGKCIDRDWTCDGKKDCLSGEDEQLPSCHACSSSQFQCSSNKACVAYQSRCDGAPNCSDGSDEAQCLTIGADGPSNPGNLNTPVQISYKGQAGFDLCADNWSKAWSDFLCKQIGYKESQETSSLSDLPSNATFLKVSTPIPPSNGSLISVLSDSGNCSTNKVVGVSCKLLDCGVRGVSDNAADTYIINGQVAARGAWPWQVFLELNSTLGISFCGGSLINDRWILTAAHCVEDVTSASNIKIQAGSTQTYSTDPELRTLTASRFIPHPLYADVKTRNVIINDVALIQLSSPVTFTATIRPICLAPTDVDLNKFKVCMATGWGRTRSQYVGIPSNLRQGKMKLRTTDECYQSYTSFVGFTWKAARSDFNYFVCAGNTLPNGGVDTCQGDSGGPLACQDQQGVWTLVGVTSFGFGDCDMSVFSRVSYFNSWINTQIQS